MGTHKKPRPRYKLKAAEAGGIHPLNENPQNNSFLPAGKEEQDDEGCDNTEGDFDESSRTGVEDIETSLPEKDPEDNYFTEGEDIQWGILDTEEDE